MNADPIPQAAVAAQLAGADDYRLTTPPEQQTPAGFVDRINAPRLRLRHPPRPERGRVIPALARTRALLDTPPPDPIPGQLDLEGTR